MLDQLIKVLQLGAYGLAALLAAGRIGYFIADTRHRLTARSMKRNERDAQFAHSFSKREIAESLRKYVRQDSSQMDPSHESDLTRVADIREGVFDALDRFIEHPHQRRHALILADSGMGKTSLCLNYFVHLQSRKIPTALVTLARHDALKHLAGIPNKRGTICILDALDEDPRAIEDVQSRLPKIFEETADFRNVIITCRSQFFRDQTSIPSETGVLVVGPRRGGSGATYKMYHLFILPFSKTQINAFLRRQFPLWNPFNYSRILQSRKLVARVPELSVRPMLLDLLPDMIREKSHARELYDLYTYMVDKWCDREEGWIGRDALIKVSEAVAVRIHSQMMLGFGDRISVTNLHDIARDIDVPSDDWRNLSARSLLNRDLEGKIKFAHRSILEYFIVRAVIDGYDEPLSRQWTDVMRELIVSWGYTASGEANVARAQHILQADLSQTTLIPLSEPPLEPAIIAMDDIIRICGGGRVKAGRRSAPGRWRKDSIKLKYGDGGYHIIDMDSDLEWAIIDYEALEREGLLREFVAKLGDQLQRLSLQAEYRLPSLDELVSLIEGCEALDRSNIIPENLLYVLGDMAGDRRYLIATFQEPDQGITTMKPVDARRPITGTERRIWLYEAGMHVDASAFRNLRVAALRVRKERQKWRTFDFAALDQIN